MAHQIEQLVAILDEEPRIGPRSYSNTIYKRHWLFAWGMWNYKTPLLYLDFHHRLRYYAKQQQIDKDC